MTMRLQVREGFEWLLSLFDRAGWPLPRSSLEPQLLAVARPPAAPVGSGAFRSVSLVPGRIVRPPRSGVPAERCRLSVSSELLLPDGSLDFQSP